MQEIRGRKRQEEALVGQISSIVTELAAVQPLAQQGLSPVNRLEGLKRDKLRMEGDLGQARADIARLTHQQEESRLQIEQAQQKFRADAAHDLADARSRLSRQLSDEAKASRSDFVIENTGDLAVLRMQVEAVWRQLVELSNKSSDKALLQ